MGSDEPARDLGRATSARGDDHIAVPYGRAPVTINEFRKFRPNAVIQRSFRAIRGWRQLV
jgi:hypothetical protein